MKTQKALSTNQSSEKNRSIVTTKLRYYYVLAKIPWFVSNVETIESACNIAVAEAAKRLPYYVDIDVPNIRCPSCGKIGKSAFLCVNDALVTLLVGLKVASDSKEGAKRVTVSIIKKSLKDKKFEILDVSELK